MLMTRILYAISTLLLLTLNGLALMSFNGGDAHPSTIIPMALTVNAVAWPIALIVSYRMGQATGIEYLRKVKARKAAIRASRTAHRSAT